MALALYRTHCHNVLQVLRDVYISCVLYFSIVHLSVSLAICNIWKLNFVVTLYRFIGLYVKDVFDFIKFANVFALTLTKLANCGNYGSRMWKGRKRNTGNQT